LLFQNELKQGAKVYGGHQYLRINPGFSITDLEKIFISSETVKLSSGAYCTKYFQGQKKILLLNAFCPNRINSYISPGHAILAMSVRGNGIWNLWREKLLGSSNPRNSPPKSIRRELYEKMNEWNIPTIDQSHNGFHFSAGPLEGMAEVINFFSDYVHSSQLQPSQTCFGSLLIKKEVDLSIIDSLVTNKIYDEEVNRDFSVFDLTEETQPLEAAKILKSYIGNVNDVE
jgi:nucleoside diphosphate kinase